MESPITTNRPERKPEFVSNQVDIIENQSEDTGSGIQQVAPTKNQGLGQESAVDEIANNLDEREVSNETKKEGKDTDEMAVKNEEKGPQASIEEVNLEEEDSEGVTGYISEINESAPQSGSKEAIKERIRKYMGKAMAALSLLSPEEAEGFFKTLLPPYVALLSPYVAYQSPSDSDEDKLSTQGQPSDDDIKNDNHQSKPSNTTNLAAQPEVQSVVNSKLSSASNKSTSSTYVQPNTNNVKINNNSYNHQSKPANTQPAPQPQRRGGIFGMMNR